jgi:hypothetical protein
VAPTALVILATIFFSVAAYSCKSFVIQIPYYSYFGSVGLAEIKVGFWKIDGGNECTGTLIGKETDVQLFGL